MDRETLVQTILDLENDREGQVTNPDLAYDLGHHVKVHIDRLVGLRSGALPLGDDEGAFPSDPGAGAIAVAAVGEKPARRRRKKKKTDKPGAPEGPLPDLMDLPPKDQARWIFMERYIPLEKHEEVLGYELESERFAEYQQAFDQLVKDLLQLPRTIEAVERNDIPALQKVFASTVLIFRNPCIGDDEGQPVPCTFEALRHHFPSYFYKRKKKPNWYETRDFYSAPMPEPKWALCDVEYLNCTLRKPERKLAGYSRDWDLPSEYIRQKTVLEDIYDRIVCGEALEEDLFANNCNCVTATTYHHRKGPARLVYTVQRIHKITIHGRVGIPHWRAKRRLWPGVFPTVVFP